MVIVRQYVRLCANQCVANAVYFQLLLHTQQWNVAEIKEKWRRDSSKLLIDARIKPERPSASAATLSSSSSGDLKRDVAACSSSSSTLRSAAMPTSASAASAGLLEAQCNICLQLRRPGDRYEALACGHMFCTECWSSHLEIQILQGTSIGIECMAQGCHIYVPEELALSLISKPQLREKYVQFAFADYVKSHPQLRFCPGINCNAVVQAKERQPMRATCKFCKVSFCFKCGAEYHAPTDCETIKRWLTKCADDSETVNYISAHTKDCPKCGICIGSKGFLSHFRNGCAFKVLFAN